MADTNPFGAQTRLKTNSGEFTIYSLKKLADYAKAHHIRLYLAMMPDIHNLKDYQFGFIHEAVQNAIATRGTPVPNRNGAGCRQRRVDLGAPCQRCGPRDPI